MKMSQAAIRDDETKTLAEREAAVKAALTITSDYKTELAAAMRLHGPQGGADRAPGSPHHGAH